MSSPTSALSIACAVVLVAFVLIILRKDVVSQAIGFFSLENGVSIASLVVASGLPLIVDVAFLFDLLVAVVVFGVIMRAPIRFAIDGHKSLQVAVVHHNRVGDPVLKTVLKGFGFQSQQKPTNAVA